VRFPYIITLYASNALFNYIPPFKPVQDPRSNPLPTMDSAWKNSCQHRHVHAGTSSVIDSDITESPKGLVYSYYTIKGNMRTDFLKLTA